MLLNLLRFRGAYTHGPGGRFIVRKTNSLGISRLPVDPYVKKGQQNTRIIGGYLDVRTYIPRVDGTTQVQWTWTPSFELSSYCMSILCTSIILSYFIHPTSTRCWNFLLFSPMQQIANILFSLCFLQIKIMTYENEI